MAKPAWRESFRNLFGDISDRLPPYRFNLLIKKEMLWGFFSVRPYIRRINGGDYFGVTSLTADALVTYKLSRLTVPDTKTVMQVVELVVSDRRDGRLLATLRYLIDPQGERACGATSDGVMDEVAFVAQAVGLGDSAGARD